MGSYEVHSKRDPNTHALLIGDMTLVLGDSSSLVFQNGIAEATEAQVQLLKRSGRDDVRYVRVEDDPEPEPEPERSAAEHVVKDTADFTVKDNKLALDPARQAAIDAAKQHLQEDGETVPQEQVQLPDGFAASTDDGAPRCLAAKGDGSQCSNEAIGDTRACGLAPHKDKVAALPRQAV